MRIRIKNIIIDYQTNKKACTKQADSHPIWPSHSFASLRQYELLQVRRVGLHLSALRLPQQSAIGYSVFLLFVLIEINSVQDFLKLHQLFLI